MILYYYISSLEGMISTIKSLSKFSHFLSSSQAMEYKKNESDELPPVTYMCTKYTLCSTVTSEMYLSHSLFYQDY